MKWIEDALDVIAILYCCNGMLITFHDFIFFETIDMIILLSHLRHIPTYVFRIEFFAITSEKHSNYYLRTIKIVCDPIIQAIIIWQNTSTLYLVAY